MTEYLNHTSYGNIDLSNITVLYLKNYKHDIDFKKCKYLYHICIEEQSGELDLSKCESLKFIEIYLSDCIIILPEKCEKLVAKYYDYEIKLNKLLDLKYLELYKYLHPIDLRNNINLEVLKIGNNKFGININECKKLKTLELYDTDYVDISKLNEIKNLSLNNCGYGFNISHLKLDYLELKNSKMGMIDFKKKYDVKEIYFKNYTINDLKIIFPPL